MSKTVRLSAISWWRSRLLVALAEGSNAMMYLIRWTMFGVGEDGLDSAWMRNPAFVEVVLLFFLGSSLLGEEQSMDVMSKMFNLWEKKNFMLKNLWLSSLKVTFCKKEIYCTFAFKAHCSWHSVVQLLLVLD